MSKTDAVGFTSGAGLAVAPGVYNKVAEVPFYETNAWLTAIAILGAFVLLATACNVALKVYLNYKEARQKWSGKERRCTPRETKSKNN